MQDSFSYDASVSRFQPLWVLLAKDFRCLWYNRALVVSTLGFALLLVVVAGFAFKQIGYGQAELRAVTPGILWIIFLFTAVLALTHSFVAEYEERSLAGIVLSGVDPLWVFASKYLSTLMFVLLAQTLIICSHAMFFGVELFSALPALLVLAGLFSIGFLALGTLLSAISVLTKEREIVLPLVLFPVSIPLVAGCVELARGVLSQGVIEFSGYWFTLVVVFDIIALTLAAVLFEHVVRD